MPDTHKVRVRWGADRVSDGVSANRQLFAVPVYLQSPVRKERLRVFIDYLSDMPANKGGREAYNCAEPHAVYKAIIAGANPWNIRFISITCNGASRNPCQDFCQNYIDYDTNMLLWETISGEERPKEFPMRTLKEQAEYNAYIRGRIQAQKIKAQKVEAALRAEFDEENPKPENMSFLEVIKRNQAFDAWKKAKEEGDSD